MSRQKKVSIHIPPRQCTGRCQLVHTGRSKLTRKLLKQGMSSVGVRYKFDKLYHLRCRQCGRGSWTTTPNSAEVSSLPDAVLDTVKNGNK